MSEADHTPGPWRIGRAGSVVADVPPEGGVLGTDDTSYYGGYLIGETITEANARLIAAAPEMLEALSRILGIIEESHGLFGFHLNGELSAWHEHQDDIDAIQNAIEKATGKEAMA